MFGPIYGERMAKVAKLKETVTTYEEAIRNFEYARERLHQKRSLAPDDTKAQIDRSLEMNQQALDSLNQALAATKAKLERLQLR